MKIAIVDDEQSVINDLVDQIKTYDKKNIFQILTYNNGFELLASDNCDVKLLFLDIEMPQINGIDVANAIIKDNSNIKIIFITNQASLVTKALHNYAFSFIPKPIDKNDLFMEIDRASSAIKTESFLLKILWNSQEEYLRVKDIVFIESLNKKCIIHTCTGKTYSSSTILQQYLIELSMYSFAQVHKSYLINLRYINNIGKGSIKLDNYEPQISISRKFKSEFEQLFNKYLNKVLI